MAQPEDILNDLFSAYQNTSNYKDQAMMEIFAQRKTFEERLDEMWSIRNKLMTLRAADLRYYATLLANIRL